jgi:hypothetical protein
MRRHCADHQRATGLLDLSQLADGPEINNGGWARQPLLHGGDQCLSAGQQLGAVFQQALCVTHGGRAMIVEGIHG